MSTRHDGHMLLRRPLPDPLLTRHDLETVFRWMFDVRKELVAIRLLLEDDGEAEAPADDA